MADVSREGPSIPEFELKEEVLEREAGRLNRELTEALMTLPQYRVAKKKAELKDDPTIEFQFDGWHCQDSAYVREGGMLAVRDLTMDKDVEGGTVVESYGIDRITPEGREASHGTQGIRADIMSIHVTASDEDPVIEARTQTAVNSIDKLIARIKTAPRLHIVPPLE